MSDSLWALSESWLHQLYDHLSRPHYGKNSIEGWIDLYDSDCFKCQLQAHLRKLATKLRAINRTGHYAIGINRCIDELGVPAEGKEG